MMIQLLLILFLNSLFIFGLHYSFSYDEDADGNIFNKSLLWFVQYYAKKFLGNYIAKLFGGCIICMASLWSLPFFFLYFTNPLFLLIYIPSLAGMNRIIIRFI